MDARNPKRSRLLASVCLFPSLPKTDLVKVFWRTQDDSWEKPAFVWVRQVCREHKEQNLGKFENHGRTFRLNKSTPAATRQFRETTPENHRASNCQSDSGISSAEMQGNAGIAPPNCRDAKYYVVCAQEKVRLYNCAGMIDSGSPLAHGAWIYATPLQSQVTHVFS